jgi:hypothetical protein
MLTCGLVLLTVGCGVLARKSSISWANRSGTVSALEKKRINNPEDEQ